MCLHLPQDVVQRVGSRGPQGDFAKALCARLVPQLISTQHVEELLKLASEEAPLDDAYLGSTLELLVDAAEASPSLFAGPVPQVICLLYLCQALAVYSGLLLTRK